MVHVRFVDAQSKAQLGETVLAPHDLPDTFDGIELDLDDAPYHVVNVEPTAWQTAARITLHLEPADAAERRVALAELGFRVPSVAEPLPTLSSTPLGLHALALDEDAYRQVELLDPRTLADAPAVHAAVQVAAAARAPDGGYSTLHHRTAMVAPLSPEAGSAALHTLLTLCGPGQPWGFMQAGTAVEGGLAWPLGPAHWVYGVRRMDGGPDALAALAFSGDWDALPASHDGLRTALARATGGAWWSWLGTGRLPCDTASAPSA